MGTTNKNRTPKGKGRVDTSSFVKKNPGIGRGRVPKSKMVNIKGTLVTPGEAKFVQGMAEGKTQQRAAFEAFNAQKLETASVMADEILKKPRVQEALEKALDHHGITIEEAVKPIADGLKATRTMVNSENQEVAREVPDHSIRLKASGMALRLLGAENGDSNKSAGINFNFGTQNFVKKVENKS